MSQGSGNGCGRWRRALTLLYLGCLSALLTPVLFLSIWKPLDGCSGLWLHATVGRWIWQTGQVPDRTLYLWTASEPYVYHSWLAELLFYGLTTICAPEHLPYVLFAFTASLTLLPFILVVRVWHGSGRLSSWMVVLFAIALQQLYPRIEHRPELFTQLFLAVLLVFLVAWSKTSHPGNGRWMHRREKLALAGILLMFVVWANVHAGVLLGVLVLSVTAACDLIQDRFHPRALVLTVLTPLALAAVCVNPYGIGYFQTYLRVGSYTFAHIAEWLPIWTDPLPSPDMLIFAAVLAALALAAWSLNPKRRLAHLGWLLLLAALFVRARRNVLPFAIVGLMVVAANARSLTPDALWLTMRRFGRLQARGEVPLLPSWVRWVFRTGLLAWLVLQALLMLPTFGALRAGAVIRLEQGIVGFLREHDLQGRVFNDYENAGYLQWRLQGRPALYIDMLDAYPDGVMRDYQAIVRARKRGRELLDEQQIEIVVLTTNRGPASSLAALAARLDTSQQWARVYVGRDGVIWVRRSAAYEHLWRPRYVSIAKVAFGTLERLGHEAELEVPPITEDFGDGSRQREMDK